MRYYQFNPTGTHVHKGLLTGRFDVFIDDPESNTYKQQHIQVATEDIPKSCFDKDGKVIRIMYEAWQVNVSKIWRLNPCLCHFVTLPEIVVKDDIREYVARLFDKDTIATLDNALVLPNSSHLVSPYMRTKVPLTDKKVETKDFADLIATTNIKLGSLGNIPLDSGGRAINIKPRSIDVGALAINRGSFDQFGTYISMDNPSNGTGTIDTIKIWCVTDLVAMEVASFFLVGGTSYSTRDSEAIGGVASGSQQTFAGRDMDIVLADLIGGFWSNGFIERDTSGFAGFWYNSGDKIPSVNFEYTEFEAGDAISLYGTGEEAGGGIEDKSANMGNKMVGVGLI